MISSRHRERYPEQWSESANRAVLGVCTGVLPAVAATAALSDTDFLQLVPEFVQLSLRLGLEIFHRSLALETSDDPWSVAVSGVPIKVVREELERFNTSSVSDWQTPRKEFHRS